MKLRELYVHIYYYTLNNIFILKFYHMFLRLWSEISLFHKLIYDIAPGSILIG